MTKKLKIDDFSRYYADLFSHSGKAHSRTHEDIKLKVDDYFKKIKDDKFEPIFSTSEVEKTLESLKKNKSGGFDKICNEFFIYGSCKNLVFLLTWFINASISYGYLPELFNVSIVTPIPKKGEMNEPKDFRPISVSTSIATIFETLLLSKIECCNQKHLNQFCYKKNLSSKHAYFLANEAINYYRQNDSRLNLIFLDASKAFD